MKNSRTGKEESREYISNIYFSGRTKSVREEDNKKIVYIKEMIGEFLEIFAFKLYIEDNIYLDSILCTRCYVCAKSFLVSKNMTRRVNIILNKFYGSDEVKKKKFICILLKGKILNE